jgi:ABC-type nitrate/sulfonate/bicarbonate transport system substrate-binding protein
VSITTLIAVYIGLYTPRPLPAIEYQASEIIMADLEGYKVYMVARSIFAHKVLVQLLESGLDEENVEYYLPVKADAKSIILYDVNKVRPFYRNGP